jgi:hypothetical protein
MPMDGEPIKLNGAFFTLCAILKFIVSSAAETELGALFLNCKEGKIFCLILKELGYPQSPTLVHCDNKAAVSIANDTIKRQRSRSMEMRYFWVTDQVNQGNYLIQWYPGQDNLGDYQSKHHIGMHHSTVRTWYFHQANLPMVLARKLAPPDLRGCVGTLPKGYIRGAILPK